VRLRKKCRPPNARRGIRIAIQSPLSTTDSFVLDPDLVACDLGYLGLIDVLLLSLPPGACPTSSFLHSHISSLSSLPSPSHTQPFISRGPSLLTPNALVVCNSVSAISACCSAHQITRRPRSFQEATLRIGSVGEISGFNASSRSLASQTPPEQKCPCPSSRGSLKSSHRDVSFPQRVFSVTTTTKNRCIVTLFLVLSGSDTVCSRYVHQQRP
jgi:hypothetical protein